MHQLDYGCYIHLTATAQERGLFEAETAEGATTFVEVPADDYRSIRRAILDLADFYAANAPPKST